MGVHRKERKNVRTKTVIIAIVIASVLIFMDIRNEMTNRSGIPWWIYLVTGIGLSIYDDIKKIYLACPNCNVELLKTI